MKSRAAWGMSGLISFLVASGLFTGGYYYGLHAGQQALRKLDLTPQGVARDSAERMLMGAVGRVNLINLLDDGKPDEAEKKLISAMTIYVDAVYSCSFRDSATAHDTMLVLQPSSINSKKWHQALKEIRDCAARKNLPTSVKQVDDVLQWLDNADNTGNKK